MATESVKFAMQRMSRFTGALAALLFPALLHAGLYNSAEPPIPLDNDLNAFLDRLAELRSYAPSSMTMDAADAGAEAMPSVRADYLKKIEILRAKEKAGPITADEAANLGAYLYRVRKTQPRLPDLQEATQVLEAGRQNHPRHFAILANLGTVYQAAGHLDAAESCLEEALALAPPELAPFELAQLRLVKRRIAEQRTVGAPSLDGIFYKNPREPLRFVGSSGRYEIGALAPAEQAKLPDGSLEKATKIVQQLLAWNPMDGRLHWLLGELAAAGGQTKAAARALDMAVDSFRLSTPELKQHRAWLMEYTVWSESLERLGTRARQAAWLGRVFSAQANGYALPLVDAPLLVHAKELAAPLQARLNPFGASGPGGGDLKLFSWDMVSWPIAAIGGLLIVSLAWLQLRLWARKLRRT
jgi:tetratricopeptide (TPR) repeat protein